MSTTPALKAADIGCAMGITGTDVAKGAADMTLTDDNFATIVDAVREGRGIYANIKKVVGFLLGTNIGEVITVFVAMLLWHKSPLLSMQLLWINLVTDSLPAIALGMEAVESGVMSQQDPRRKACLRTAGRPHRAARLHVCHPVADRVLIALDENRAGQMMAFIVLSVSQIRRTQHALGSLSVYDRCLHQPQLNVAALLSLAQCARRIDTSRHPVDGFTSLLCMQPRWDWLWSDGHGSIQRFD
ncbi:MAG: cation transporting ATPase C-terminal domain-containing protein [Merdibacter sp.]